MITNKKKVTIFISALFLTLCMLGGCTVPYSNIAGKLLDYTKAEENGGHGTGYTHDDFLKYGYMNFDMTQETAQDVAGHMADYTAYRVGIYIRNESSFPIYMLRAGLAEECKDLWLDHSSLYKGVLDLEANQEFKDSSISILVKTAGENEAETDSLIRSMKLRVSWCITPSTDELGAFNVITFEN